jgi:hypothetical protein
VEAVKQEGEEGGPTGKTKGAGERAQILKAGLAAHEGAAQLGVRGSEPVEQGGKEAGQEIAGCPECGQRLRAMAAVVCERRAVSLAGIGGFILDLPARPARLDARGDGCSGQRELGHKRVVRELGARGSGERQLPPLAREGLRAGA